MPLYLTKWLNLKAASGHMQCASHLWINSVLFFMPKICRSLNAERQRLWCAWALFLDFLLNIIFNEVKNLIDCSFSYGHDTSNHNTQVCFN